MDIAVPCARIPGVNMKKSEKEMDDYCEVFEFLRNGNASDESIQTIGEEKLKGNDNAKKQERKIEIGWFDYDYRSSEYRQVRTLNGGGVRYINAPKTWMQDDILQHGKKVFFLNGKSKRGNVTDFQFEVRNFMGGRMDNDCTIGDLYTLTGSKLLRFYIYSKKLPTTAVGCSEMESPSDDSLPDHKLLQVNKQVANLSSDPSNESPSKTSSLTPQTVQLRVQEFMKTRTQQLQKC